MNTGLTLYKAINDFLGGGFEHFLDAKKYVNLPFNVYTKGDTLEEAVIELAVAGYKAENIDVQRHQGSIVVSGKMEKSIPSDYLMSYQGLTSKNFTYTFPVAPSYEVENVELEAGLLRIYLKRENESWQSLKITEK